MLFGSLDSSQKIIEYTESQDGFVLIHVSCDPQVLHDAFFKYQTKPKLTHHGDLYHEGKEFEVLFSHIDIILLYGSVWSQ